LARGREAVGAGGGGGEKLGAGAGNVTGRILGGAGDVLRIGGGSGVIEGIGRGTPAGWKPFADCGGSIWRARRYPRQATPSLGLSSGTIWRPGGGTGVVGGTGGGV